MNQKVNEDNHSDDSFKSNDNNLINCKKIFTHESDFQCIIDSGVEIGGGGGSICG